MVVSLGEALLKFFGMGLKYSNINWMIETYINNVYLIHEEQTRLFSFLVSSQDSDQDSF